MGFMKGAVAGAISAAVASVVASAPAHATPVNNMLYPDDQASEFVATIQRVAWEFGLPPITVNSADLAPLTYASASPGIITVNRDLSTDPAHWQAMFESDLKEGFHRSGHCTAQEYVAYHEVAHQIDFRDGTVYKEAQQVWDRFGYGEQLRGQVSDYSYHPGGGLFAPEALAEAFTAVRCGVGTPVEHELVTILID